MVFVVDVLIVGVWLLLDEENVIVELVMICMIEEDVVVFDLFCYEICSIFLSVEKCEWILVDFVYLVLVWFCGLLL